MVSKSCIIYVKQVLDKLKIKYVSVSLGEIDLVKMLNQRQHNQLAEELCNADLELVDDKIINRLIQDIKTKIVENIDNSESLNFVNCSVYLAKKLSHDYTYMSNIFAKVEGISIQEFCLNYKIKKVKEYILNGKYNFAEISYKLNYSSPAHLTNQFKKRIGVTPSKYKKLHLLQKNRIKNQ